MKKILLVLVAAAFLAVPVIFSSCDKDNPVDCTKMLDDISDASTAYWGDPSTANCNDYKDALKDYLDSDCTLASIYQSTYDNLSCN